MKTRTNQPITDYEGIVEGLEEQASSGIKLFEDIKDKDGHARFVQGDITSTSLPTGATITFGKWALSGNHLLIVLAINATSGTSITGYTYLGTLENLPDWIYEKISVLFGSNVVTQDSKYWYASDSTSQAMTYRLYKQNGSVFFFNTGTFTLTADRTIRMSVDLLIDNE